MELADYRKELDETDAQLLELFKKRMSTVKNIAEYKRKTISPCSSRAESAKFWPLRRQAREKSLRTMPAHFSQPSWMSAALIRRG